MSKFFYIFWKYEPETAIFQRNWGLAKGVADRGIEVKAIFWMPNKGLKCLNPPANMECIYLGETSVFKNKILCLLSSIVRTSRLIKPNDHIIGIILVPALILMNILLPKNVFSYLILNEYPPLFYKGIFLKLLLFMARKSSHLFVISNKMKEYFINNGIKSNKITVVNMTVNIERFHNLRKEKTERYICYCGTVSTFKDGVDILIKSFALISSSFPDVKLYILGPIPSLEDKNVIQSLIEELNIKDRVYLPGKIPGEKMPQYLKNAEILALARPNNIQAAYGFPTKVGEYLMTENPVVLTRVGELDSFIKDGETCIFAEPDDANDFAEKLRWTLSHKEEASFIGKRGKEIALKSFNSQTESGKIEKIILENNR